jgi:hypothetical protein
MEIAEQQGATPRALQNRPQLQPGLELYLNAFLELQTERPIGMTAGPIPWGSIIRWAEFNAVEDVDVLIRHVRALERASMEFDRKGGQ